MGGVHHFHTDGTLRFAIEQGHVRIKNDNSRLQIGTNNDLQLYHVGSVSFIDDAGTGSLNIRTTSSSNVTIKSTNDVMAKFKTADAVELYHNNIKQLETDSGGIIVTDNDTTSYVNLTTSSGNAGYLYASGSTDFGLLDGQQHWLVKGVKDGKVELRYDNSVRVERDISYLYYYQIVLLTSGGRHRCSQ